MAPVHHLPTEIFHQIFFEAVNPTKKSLYDGADPRYYARIVCLSSVCWHWAGIVRKFAELWTKLDALYHPKLVSVALERSQGRPLQVACEARGSYRWSYEAGWGKERFFSKISDTISRWETARLVIHSAQTLSSLSLLHASNLKSLRLTAERGSLNISPALQALQYHTCPLKLEKLELRGVYIPLDSPLFVGLRVLRLSAIKQRTSVSQLINAIRNCPRLVQLHLAHLPVRQDVPHDAMLPVYLPELDFLIINNLPPNVMQHLISLLQFPACTSVEIDGTFCHRQDALVDVLFASLSPMLQRVLIDTRPEGISISSTWESLVLEIENPTCVVTLNRVDGETVLSCLLERYEEPLAQGCDTILIKNTYRYRFDYVVQRLQKLRNLRYLDVVDRSVGAKLIHMLAEPYDDDGILKWYFPSLHKILIHGCTFNVLEAVKKMVDLRTAGVPGLPTPEHQELPVPIRNVSFFSVKNIHWDTCASIGTRVPRVFWNEVEAGKVAEADRLRSVQDDDEFEDEEPDVYRPQSPSGLSGP